MTQALYLDCPDTMARAADTPKRGLWRRFADAIAAEQQRRATAQVGYYLQMYGGSRMTDELERRMAEASTPGHYWKLRV